MSKALKMDNTMQIDIRSGFLKGQGTESASAVGIPENVDADYGDSSCFSGVSWLNPSQMLK